MVLLTNKKKPIRMQFIQTFNFNGKNKQSKIVVDKFFEQFEIFPFIYQHYFPESHRKVVFLFV